MFEVLVYRAVLFAGTVEFNRRSGFVGSPQVAGDDPFQRIVAACPLVFSCLALR